MPNQGSARQPIGISHPRHWLPNSLTKIQPNSIQDIAKASKIRHPAIDEREPPIMLPLSSQKVSLLCSYVPFIGDAYSRSPQAECSSCPEDVMHIISTVNFHNSHNHNIFFQRASSEAYFSSLMRADAPSLNFQLTVGIILPH